jgi:hypothetical protein
MILVLWINQVCSVEIKLSVLLHDEWGESISEAYSSDGHISLFTGTKAGLQHYAVF